MNNFHPITDFVSAITGVATVAALWQHEHTHLPNLRRWQEMKVLGLLRHAYQAVPYYRKAFVEAGIRTSNLRSIEDLKLCPTLARSDVQMHQEELISSDAVTTERNSLIPVYTTGSSGTPVRVMLNRREYYQSLSHVLYGFLRAGAGIQDTFVHIHVPPGKIRHYSFERLGILQQVHLDLRMGERSTLEELRRLRSPVLYSFPSYLQSMADLILKDNVRSPEVKLIVSNGEQLHEHAREKIQLAFRCPVFNSYGAAEVFRIAYECRHRRFHMLPDSSIVEIDQSTLAPDGSAEIIVTPLYLRTMPLIRYRLGDRIILGTEPCPCGSPWTTIERVCGRIDDQLTLPSGRRISPRAINILENVPGIREYQIIQRTPSEFQVLVAPSAGFGPQSQRQIAQAITDGCAPDPVNVTIHTTATIPRTPAGKLRAVISEVHQ